MENARVRFLVICLGVFVLMFLAWLMLPWLKPRADEVVESMSSAARLEHHKGELQGNPSPASSSAHARRREAIGPAETRSSVRLQGSVVGDGVPLAGATVYALSGSDSSSSLDAPHVARTPSDPPGSHVIAEASTNPEGGFSLRIPRAWIDRPIDLVGRHFGYVRNGLTALTPSSVKGALTLQLERGLSILGHVVALDGEKTEGLRVVATTDFMFRGRSLRKAAGYRRQVEARPSLADGYAFSEAKVGPDGGFQIQGLFRGEYVLNVVGADWLMLSHHTVSAGDSDIVLKVYRGLRFKIEVVDEESGQPVDTFGLQGSIGVRGDQAALALTGRGGNLDFIYGSGAEPPLAEAGFQGTISSSSYSPADVSVQSRLHAAGSARVALKRPDLVKMRLRINDSEGKIVKGAAASFAPLKGEDFRSCSILEDRKGQQYLQLPTGKWVVHIRHPRLFPLGKPWQGIIEVPARTAQSVFQVRIDTRDGLTLNLGGLPSQRSIRSILLTSHLGHVRLPRPKDTASGRIRWIGVPYGLWTVKVQPEGVDPIRKEIRVAPGDVRLNF